MKITNELGLPQAIVNAVENDPYDGGGAKSDISVTRLIAPPQLVQLTNQHWDDITEDASMRLWALMGQAMHVILERAETNAITEQRLFMTVDGPECAWNVSGQFDRMFLTPTGTLQDYKFSSVWEFIHGLKPDRIAQLNLLAHLAIANGYDIEQLEVVFLFRDWIPSKAKTDKSYPQTQMARVPVQLWEDDERHGYLHQRVAVHQAARYLNVLPECTPEERWEQQTTFAVMKGKNKRAVRVFDNEDTALKMVADNPDQPFWIDTRVGESRRCATYCPVSAFCPQYMRMVEPPDVHAHN